MMFPVNQFRALVATINDSTSASSLKNFRSVQQYLNTLPFFSEARFTNHVWFRVQSYFVTPQAKSLLL